MMVTMELVAHGLNTVIVETKVHHMTGCISARASQLCACNHSLYELANTNQLPPHVVRYTTAIVLSVVLHVFLHGWMGVHLQVSVAAAHPDRCSIIMTPRRGRQIRVKPRISETRYAKTRGRVQGHRDGLTRER